MFFSKKNKGPKISDVVYLGEAGCNNAIGKWLQENHDGVVVVWFQHDLEQLRSKLGFAAEDRFVLADRLAYTLHSPKPVLFAGHYPLHAAELELCESVSLDKMLVYTHLDAALFQRFGAERIKELMIKMGMGEDDPVNHSMITSAITNAQEKIAKNCTTEMRATSEAEWFQMNLPAK